MIDLIELRKQLAVIEEGYAPIIQGRNNPRISVSIPYGYKIPDGWKPTTSPKGYFPENTVRIVLDYSKLVRT